TLLDPAVQSLKSHFQQLFDLGRYLPYWESPSRITAIALVISTDVDADDVPFFEDPFPRDPMDHFIVDRRTNRRRISVITQKSGFTVVLLEKVERELIEFLRRNPGFYPSP